VVGDIGLLDSLVELHLSKASLPPRLATAAFSAVVALVTLAATLCFATLIVDSVWLWQLHSALPREVRALIANAALFILQPVQPAEVHAQEGQLELYLAWCFVVLLGAAVSAFGLAMHWLKHVAPENAT